MRAAAAVLLIAASHAAPAATQTVAVQLVLPSPEVSATLRLDGRQIFHGSVTASRNPDTGPAPLTVDRIVHSTGPHRLQAAIGTTSAEFRWTRLPHGPLWIVVSYYPGRPGEESPRISFSLQAAPAMAK